MTDLIESTLRGLSGQLSAIPLLIGRARWLQSNRQASGRRSSIGFINRKENSK